MRLLTIALGLLAGCGKSADDPEDTTLTASDTDPADTDTTPGTTTTTTDTGTAPVDTGPFELHGTRPAVALAPIDFTDVVNQDVELRSKADLLGHPTVMWFYPAASTAG